MSDDLGKVIDYLELRIKELLKKQEALMASYQKIETHLEEECKKNAALKQDLEDLRLRNVALKNANALLGSKSHSREVKLKINALIKDIDQCIAQLI